MKKTTTASIEVLNIKALLYGKSGVGKTSTALTLDPESTLIISAESGLLPLRGKNFDVWEIGAWSELHDVYQELLLPETRNKYKTIFIDSLTELNEALKEQIVKKDRPAIKTKLGEVYDDMMTLQDWGLLATRMTRFIRKFRDLPYNVIVTCLEDSNKDDQTGAINYVPSINGKLALNIAGYFDEVFRMVIKEEGENITRYFLTDKTERSIAKDRSGILPRLSSPDWGEVFRLIKTDVTQEVA